MPYTKEQMTIYMRKWREDHREQFNATARKSRLKNRDVRNARLRVYNRNLRHQVLYNYSFGSMQCYCCGNDYEPFLTIDHINGGGRKHMADTKVGMGSSFYAWLKRNNFPVGFRVLCSNCNGRAGDLPGNECDCPQGKARREAM